MAEPNTLEAWREVHSTLLKACEMAQDSVDHLKMEERYWLEELSSNLTVDGTLSGTSVWNQPRKPNLVKRKAQAPPSKRKRANKKSESPNKAPAAKKIKLNAKKVKKSPQPAQQLSKRKLPKKKQIIALAATADSDDETGFNEDTSIKNPGADEDDDDDEDASSTDAAASIVSMGTGGRDEEDDDEEDEEDVAESFAVESSEPRASPFTASSSRDASPHPSQQGGNDANEDDDEEEDSDFDETMVCRKRRNEGSGVESLTEYVAFAQKSSIFPSFSLFFFFSG